MLYRGILAALLATTAAFGDTINVPGDYPTIQRAIEIAQEGDTVLVAPGTYYESINFLGKGILVLGANGAGETIIDAAGAKGTTPVVAFHSQEDPDSVLNGFTLTGGSGFDPTGYGSCGGGIYIYSSSPTILKCVITENSAECQGGGAFVQYGNPRFEQCDFVSNTVGGGANCIGQGGGLYALYSSPSVIGCLFSSNAAQDLGGAPKSGVGGGLFVADPKGFTSFLMTDSIVRNNTAGGMHIVGTGGSTVANCVFENNTNNGDGGGIDAAGNIEFLQCTIQNNTAAKGGGVNAKLGTDGDGNAISPFFFRCTIDGNSAAGLGGGVLTGDQCNSEFRRCSISGNSAGTGGGGALIQGPARLDRCRITNNETVDLVDDARGGGVLYTNSAYGLICDSVITNNRAALGGGIASQFASPVLANCVIYDNLAGRQGGGVHVEHKSQISIGNSILWGNKDESGQGELAQLFADEGGMPTIDHCVVQSWSGSNQGNAVTSNDPRWVDPDGPDNIPGTPDDDFHLFPTSPCIDAGSNYIPTANDFDFDGDPRFIDDPWTADTGTGSPPIIDIGPDEFMPATSGSPGFRLWLSGNGNFGDAGQWSPQEVPDSDDHAVVEVGGTVGIALLIDATVQSMHHTNGDVTLDLAGNGLTVLAPLRVGPYEGKIANLLVEDSTSSGASTFIADELVVGPSGTLILDESVSLELDTATLTNGAVLGGNSIVNGDVFNIAGRVAPGFTDVPSTLNIGGDYNQNQSGSTLRGPEGNCPAGEIPDCNGNCAPEYWLGDGYCDDGTYKWNGVPIYFDCQEFQCDWGDCGSWNGTQCSGSGGGGGYGACCFGTGCDEMYADACAQSGGEYQGDGTTCANDPCGGGSDTGACCLDDTCYDQIPAWKCEYFGGTYQGDGTTCENDPCSSGNKPGGCCLPSGSCVVTTREECLAGGGSFLGEGTTCDDDPCDGGGGGDTGACCLGAGCMVLAPSDCINKGGEYLGNGVTCDGDPCGQPVTGGGTLAIDVAGRIPGETHDHLSVGGNATLGGGIQLDFDPDFAVYPDDTFDVLSATSVSGNFGSLWTRGLPSHKAARAATPSARGTGDVWIDEVDPIAFEQGLAIGLAGMPTDMIVADIDSNDTPDVAMSMPSGDVVVILNPGTGAGTTITTGVGTNPMGLAAGDLDGDTYGDVVVANHDDNSISVLLFNNATSSFDVTTFTTAAGPSAVGIGNFIHADSALDLAVACTDGHVVQVWENSLPIEGAPFSVAGTIPTSSPTGVDPGDVGDTKDLDDYVITSTSGDTVSIRDGDGSGSVLGMLYTPVAVGDMPVAQAVADFDADGIDDVATVNETADTWSLIRDGGSGSESFALGGDPSDVVAGDLDGDGDPDIVFVAADDDSGDRTLMVGRNDTEPGGTHTINRAGLVGAGTDPWQVGIGDMDDDGDTDLIAVANTAGVQGSWSIIIFDQVPAATPCPGDIDGSGSVDVADLLAIIAAWGQTGDLPEDLNDDDVVNVADLLQLIGLWGACPA